MAFEARAPDAARQAARKHLLISSWVADASVGASAGQLALATTGRAALVLPTVVLSNHAGRPHVGRAPAPAEAMVDLFDALDANGALDGLGAVLTGYVPTPEHAAAAAEIVARVRAAAPGATVVCDPVLGDTPKGLYVPHAVADAIRDRLAPLADILTPNLFELAWLTNRFDVLEGDATAVIEASRAALATIATRPGARMATTSAPTTPDAVAVFDVDARSAHRFDAPRASRPPHGLGDMFAAFLAAGDPVGLATARTARLAAISDGALAARMHPVSSWAHARPATARPIDPARSDR